MAAGEKGFKKGKEGNGGVHRGPNKLTKAAKEALADIVNGNVDKVSAKMDMLKDPKDWLTFYFKMCEFVVPKQQAVAVSAEVKKSDFRSEIMEMSEREVE